ncbi:hypothetical protein PoB_003517000 [Plakobranchus ocellatus]|uniref:Secreted protein n=1 Tax=Plakobranchus ocellatus TaxID=259542 RepID=A0AAV4AKG5_9GAST|nr:hypothetical protein PoB_003517000 [Plakobranchus ocellatus]
MSSVSILLTLCTMLLAGQSIESARPNAKKNAILIFGKLQSHCTCISLAWILSFSLLLSFFLSSCRGFEPRHRRPSLTDGLNA